MNLLILFQGILGLILILIIVVVLRKKNTFFSPINYCIFFSSMTFIYFIFTGIDINFLDYRVYKFLQKSNIQIEIAFLRVFFIVILGIIFEIIGIIFGEKINSIFIVPNCVYKKKLVTRFLIISSIISILFLIILMIKSGGIIFYLQNFNKLRVFFLKGNGFIHQIILIIRVVPVVYLWWILNNNYKITKINKYLLAFSILEMFVILNFLGGRFPIFFTLLLCLFIYSLKQKIHFFNWKFVVIILILSIYIIVVPILRHNSHISSEIFSNMLSKILEQINPSYIEVFTTNLFWNKTKLYGNTLLDPFRYLVRIIIGQRDSRPPLDEGVYIFNYMKGKVFEIGDSASSLHLVGWPINTSMSMFINFGLIGVVIGKFIRGLVLGCVYKILRVNKNNLILSVLYFYMLFRFELSNHSMSILIIECSFFTILMILFFPPKINKFFIKLRSSK